MCGHVVRYVLRARAASRSRATSKPGARLGRLPPRLLCLLLSSAFLCQPRSSVPLLTLSLPGRTPLTFLVAALPLCHRVDLSELPTSPAQGRPSGVSLTDGRGGHPEVRLKH